MSSSQEVQHVGNLTRASGKCSGNLVGIGGSASGLGTIEFNQYVPSRIPGKLSDAPTKM